MQMVLGAVVLGLGLVVSASAAAAPGAPRRYTVRMASRNTMPTLSHANPKGKGSSPCYETFNPAYLPPGPGFKGGLLLRLAGCNDTNAADGMPSGEHIGFAQCDLETGVCQDVDRSFSFEPGSEDPRGWLCEAGMPGCSAGYYYNFYFGTKNKGSCVGDCHVELARTRAPLNAASWQHVTTLPWHRNGCCILRKTPPHYCIFGEGSSAKWQKQWPSAGPYPMPGLGIATTMDFDKGVFTNVNWTGAFHGEGDYPATSPWLDAMGPSSLEAKLEAGTRPVLLSTGDYLHLYAAVACDKNNPRGNYTVGWMILDGNDPSHVLQRSSTHLMEPTSEFESLCDGVGSRTPSAACKYSGERARVIFISSADPLPGKQDMFRVFWGGGDGSVGTGVVAVKPE